jgi:hypothetical protein
MGKEKRAKIKKGARNFFTSIFFSRDVMQKAHNILTFVIFFVEISKHKNGD